MAKRTIAFDFDGVLCDGLREYFHSSSLAYQSLNTKVELQELESVRDNFYQLRPVIETGWEMVVLIHALREGYSPEAIWQDWSGIVQNILGQTGWTSSQLMQSLDQERDRQIKEELDHWLSLHRFYDGVVSSLQKLLTDDETDVYIITTKEGRFTHQLLKQSGIDFPRQNIFGKESKQPKKITLNQLRSPDSKSFWFIEDRLKTLEKVAQDPALKHLQLFLATWGYNRINAPSDLEHSRITAVTLKQWQQNLDQFLKN